MRLAQAILAATFFSITNQHEITKRASNENDKKVVCYYTNWSVYRPGTAKFNPQNINPYLCTHLIYAFGGLDRENGLRPYDKYQDIEQGGYAKFTGLKTYNKQLKTLLAIGGWNEGSARFSPLVADEKRRHEFVRNVIKFLRQNHFDGLDLDWEYPAYRDGGKPKDKENYAQLVQELREEFDRESSKTGRPRLLLTMAVPAGIEYIDKGYDIPKLNRYLDFMNILSYDYHSAFEPSVNHHSPLYSIEEESEYNFDSQLTIDATIKHYLMKGADAEKLVLGIPTYGRSYTLFNADSTELGAPSDGPGEQGEATREKGYLAYYEICGNINDGWTVIQPKETAMGPYAYKENQWVGYDDESIVKKKSEYVNQKDLGGIMFWSIDNDDFRGKCHERAYPLIEAAKEALFGKGISNKLPSSIRGGKTSKPGKPKTTVRTTTRAPVLSHTTPEPPTTPDPGSDFVCKDEGFFPHPRDCKKYFWCLDSGPSDLGIVAHQFTCPSGLFFNKAADSCDFARNVICKKKSASTTTAATTTTSTPITTKAAKITYAPRTTTTTTTEAVFIEEEEEEEEDRDNAEDPQAIKQLISLIKKLGGVAELEKQLEASGGTDSTTPAISKSLYQRVLNSGTPRYQTLQRNGPSGPQNEGLPRESQRSSSFRRDKPQYVTIRRERPSSTTTESTENVYTDEAEDDVEDQGVKYQTITRNRGSQTPVSSETDEKPFRPKYQPSERFRPKLRVDVTQNEDKSTTLKYASISRSRPTTDASATTSKYVILQRQRNGNSQSEDEVTTQDEVNMEEEVTEHVIQTTTSRPRVKVSDDVDTTTITIPTSTINIPTSTRVVTEVVEGATRRQRVPLSKLKLFLKDIDNSVVDLVNVKNSSHKTEVENTEKSILNRFRYKKPEIIITSTARTTPAFLSQRKYRQRTTTEHSDISTRGHFVPKRTRNKSFQSKEEKIFTPKQQGLIFDKNEDFSTKKSIDNDSLSRNKEKYPFRNRFASRKKTNEQTLNVSQKNDDLNVDHEDELFIRGDSRDSNVIRRPILKPRFPPRRGPLTSTVSTTLSTTNSSPVTEPIEITSEEIAASLLVPSSDLIYKTESVNDDLLGTTTEYFQETIDRTNNPNNNITESNTVSAITEISLGSLGESTTYSEQEVTEINDVKLEKNYSNISKSLTKYRIRNTISTTAKVPVHTNVSFITERLNRGRQFENQNSTLKSIKISDAGAEIRNRKRIILRKIKMFTANNTSTSTTETNLKNISRTNLVARRKRPQKNVTNSDINVISTESYLKPIILKRGKKRYQNIKSVEDNIALSSKQNIESKIHESPLIQTNSLAPNASNIIKHKRIVIRGRKKHNTNLKNSSSTDNGLYNSVSHLNLKENSQEIINETHFSKTDINEPVHKNKLRVRKVILRKPVKDLEVEESSSFNRENFRSNSRLNSQSRTVVADSAFNGNLIVDVNEDFIHRNNGEQEIQTRSRRPFRKTIVRTQTTTTTEAPTTEKQRTTIQSLRQRLNRFKTERKNTLSSSTPFSKEYGTDVLDDKSQTSKPVRKELRKLLRPLPIDDSQLDASHDVSKNTPQNSITSYQKSKPIEQVTEGSQVSEEYSDEEPIILPDLANVAVVAIQSLATSLPPSTTEQIKTPVTEKITRRPIVRKRPATRPTVSIPLRSTPRPFSKIVYEEYDDYSAEPVEVPLSGKVRIHNDGYIECLDIGNFPHPFSCRKFISCAKMESSNLLGWEYTCPKGLSFDPIGGICNWNAGLGCKE